MKSKIGISTWCLQQLSHTEGKELSDFIEITAAMGADGIDICEEYLPCHPNANLMELNRIRNQVSEYGLTIGAVWFCADILSGIYAENLKRVLEEFKRNIAITAQMEAKFICLPFLLNVPGLSRQEATGQLTAFFEKALPIAEEYGIPIAHETARQYTPELALTIRKTMQSEYYTICPDLEAWRIDTKDLPLGAHAENLNAVKPEPTSMEVFRECLPYSPYIHFKLLSLDEQGEEPHFPIPDIMDAIARSEKEHYLCIEYEGWIPGFHPERNVREETKKAMELIKRYQK